MSDDRQQYLDLLKKSKSKKVTKEEVKETIKYDMEKLEDMHPAIREAIERAMSRNW